MTNNIKFKIVKRILKFSICECEYRQVSISMLCLSRNPLIFGTPPDAISTFTILQLRVTNVRFPVIIDGNLIICIVVWKKLQKRQFIKTKVKDISCNAQSLFFFCFSPLTTKKSLVLVFFRLAMEWSSYSFKFSYCIIPETRSTRSVVLEAG